jgi:hypothetical protein
MIGLDMQFWESGDLDGGVGQPVQVDRYVIWQYLIDLDILGWIKMVHEVEMSYDKAS